MSDGLNTIFIILKRGRWEGKMKWAKIFDDEKYLKPTDDEAAGTVDDMKRFVFWKYWKGNK